MIYIDAFGGDNAPLEIVKGAVEAVKEYDTELTLVGDEEKINNVFEKYNLSKNKINIVHASQVVDPNEESAFAVRRKKDSSMVVAANLVKENENSVLVSAGSTGALLAAGTLVIGRIKGVLRPALGAVLPARKKPVLLMDCGANADCKKEYINQFAIMASVYMESVLGVKNPKVYLANIGTEEKKGTILYKETHELLKENKNINFLGNIEGRDLMDSEADVIVCDGFTGNMILKLVEGMASFMKDVLKDVFYASTATKIGALLVKKSLSENLGKLDYNQYGGAPLMGINGGIIKAHGSSNATAIKNAIRQAILFSDNNVLEKIKKNLS